MEAWNVLFEQLGHAQTENKQMKKFVKKYVPFNKRNNDYHKQNPKPNKQMQQSETDEEIVPKINKVEVHNEPDEDEELAYMLWNHRWGMKHMIHNMMLIVTMVHMPTTHLKSM